jgi:hypothetical protein
VFWKPQTQALVPQRIKGRHEYRVLQASLLLMLFARSQLYQVIPAKPRHGWSYGPISHDSNVDSLGGVAKDFPLDTSVVYNKYFVRVNLKVSISCVFYLK